MQSDVTIRMGRKFLVKGNANPTEDEMIPLGEGMDIIAVTNSQHCDSR